MNITPSDIEFLIHCHARPEPHPRFDAPAIQDAIQKFLQDGIIESYGTKKMYCTTMKGKTWLLMLQNTPYPELIYVDPRVNKKEL